MTDQPESSFLKAFVNVINQASDSTKMVIDANKDIRRELFKLFYLEGTFDLFMKGDAQEALMRILTLIHASQINPKLRK